MPTGSRQCSSEDSDRIFDKALTAVAQLQRNHVADQAVLIYEQLYVQERTFVNGVYSSVKIKLNHSGEDLRRIY